jgi:hypothetical protein
MKGKRTFATVLALGLMLSLMAGLGQAQGPVSQGITAPQAQVGTAFTYQGQLKNASGLVDGTCDFRFSLWDALNGGTQVGTTQTKTNVTVSEGLFTVELDYGADFWVFSGSAYWLQIAVRCPAGSGTYTALSPRQPLTPAPYALSLRPGATIHNTTPGSTNHGLALYSDDAIGLVVGSAGGDGVSVSSAGDDGVSVYSADGSGVEIGSVGQDGVVVNQVGSPTTTASSTLKNGFEVAGAQGYGLYVGQADQGGVYVNQAGDDGVYVGRAGNPTNTFPQTGKNGFEVAGTEAVGLQVGRADIYGVWVNSAGYIGVGVTAAGTDGMLVYRAGNASTTVSSSANNGFELNGAEGYGLFVGQADLDGVYVNSATYDGLRLASAGWDGVAVDSAVASGLYVASTGGDGVNVNEAGDDGVYVFKAGSPSTTSTDAHKNGFEVAGAQGYGLYVGRADMAGVVVNTAGSDGVYVNQSAGNGFSVAAATTDGVFAHTTNASHNYGLYTPDNLYSLNYHLAGALMLVAQSGESGDLEPGEVVAVSGVGAVFADGEAPVALVQRAGPGSNIMGVVYSRFVAEEEVREIEHEGQVEQQTSLHAHSAEGPIAPGDYLLVVVTGAAQVKAEALSEGVLPGDLLAASAGGLATSAAPAEINGLAYYPPGSILGMAMEPLDATQGSGLIWVLVNPR